MRGGRRSTRDELVEECLGWSAGQDDQRPSDPADRKLLPTSERAGHCERGAEANCSGLKETRAWGNGVFFGGPWRSLGRETQH